MEKKKIFIIVEGVTDLKIISEFIQYHYLTESQINELGKSTKTIENDNYNILLFKISGWTNIFHSQRMEDIKEKDEIGYNCVVILDADDIVKDDFSGGFTKRKSRIERWKIESELNFSLFLLPNHKDDGDIEKILLESFPEERQEVINCLKQYRECLKKCSTLDNKKIPDDKKIVGELYMKLFKDDLFNFDSKAFKPLKEFLDKIFL